MLEVVICALLVWQLNAVSNYDEIADYWYSSDDGFLADALTPDSLYRSRVINETLEITDHKPKLDDSSMRYKRHHKTDDIYEYENQRRDDNAQMSYKNDKKLLNLQDNVTEDEAKQCEEGTTKEYDCNHCVCMGGQLYVCTAKRCMLSNNNGELQLMSYREEKRDECIEGEEIQSFDCNICWCSGGNIACTQRVCQLSEQNSSYEAQEQCLPGIELPSPDSCNTCGCTNLGEKYCTVKTCVINSSNKSVKNAGCIPQTWYSLYNPASNCKECFCLDGKHAFCYLKLCQGSEYSYGYRPKLMSKSIKCLRGQVRNDECTKCTCNYKEEWKCYTMMTDKCSGPSPKPKQLKLPGKKNRNLHGDKKTKVYYNKSRNQKSHGFRSKLLKHPSSDVLSGDVNVPGTNIDNADSEGYGEVKTPTRPNESEERPNVPGYDKDDKPVKSPFGASNRAKSSHQRRRTTTPADSNDDNYIVNEVGQNTIGPLCNPGQYFNQGTKQSCHGCFCTQQSEWRCFSSAQQCQDAEKKTCGEGAIVKNKKSLCSACYCDDEGNYICAIDQFCAQALDSNISCNSLKCSKTCVAKSHYYGVCIRDKCTCV